MTNRTGKRAVLTGANQPIEIWERESPGAGPGEAVLKLEFGGVCGTDVHFWHGEVPLPGPVVLGHEGIGIIEELGEGLATDSAGAPIAIGDRVYWQPVTPCNHCYPCTILNDVSMCENAFASLFGDANAPTPSTYSEVITLGAGLPFYKLPDDTSSEAVIAFGCAMPTMLQGMERLGGIQAGQTVVVQGSGPVGLAATMLAHLAGAHQVIMIGAPAPRLEMARKLGADHTIDITQITSVAERTERVRELTNGRGAEVVIEAAGVLEAFSEGLQLVAPSGRYLIVGLWSAPGTVAVEPRLINNGNLQIIGTALAGPRHLYQAIQVAQMQQSRLPMAEAISHRFTVEQSQQALEAVAAQETVKAVLVPG